MAILPVKKATSLAEDFVSVVNSFFIVVILMCEKKLRTASPVIHYFIFCLLQCVTNDYCAK
jgi:hypothetical protein